VSALIDFFADEPGLLADKTLEHLVIAAIAIAISRLPRLSVCQLRTSNAQCALSYEPQRR